MDMYFISFFEKCFDWLKSADFEFLDVNLNLFDCLIGGIFLYLIFYLIFRVGD